MTINTPFYASYLSFCQEKRCCCLCSARMSPLRSQNTQEPAAGAIPGVAVPPNNATAPAAGGLPGPAPGTAGPHRYDLANKLDPTVDSQHGGTQILGPGIHGQSVPANTAGVSHAHAHGQQVSAHDGTAAPLNSYAPGAIDPSVNARNGNYVAGTHARGDHVGGQQAGNLANTQVQPGSTVNPAHTQLQPGSTTTSHAASSLYQPGPAPNTAGPHRHDILNKLDPTVQHKAVQQATQQYRTS